RETQQLLSAAVNVAEELLLPVVQWPRLFADQESGKADHSVERLTQVVRYRVCERFELLVGPLQLTIGRLELGRAIREPLQERGDRKSTRLNSSHVEISYAVFCLKKKNLIRRGNVCLKLVRW